VIGSLIAKATAIPPIIPPNSQGEYIQYLRASLNADGSPSSYFAVSLSAENWTQHPGACSASLSASQVDTSGTSTTFFATPVACADNMTIRTVVFGAQANIMVNGKLYQVSNITVSTGMPGIGGVNLNNGNGISQVKFGPLDTEAPSGVNPNISKDFTTSVYPNSVTAEWQAAVDNPSDGNGVGVVYYVIQRCEFFGGACVAGSGAPPFNTYTASFYDYTVVPSTVYCYYITPVDFHGNFGQTKKLNVATPPAGSNDPHRAGVQRTGSYWGGAGEQIDLVSGNLNFTLPLVTAVGRNGLQATFALSHNSQNWRSAGGIDRMLGADTGYGFGWQLMLGSVLPVWGPDPTQMSFDGTIQYYLYTDSTGAQYRLDQHNNTGVWSSLNSVYVWFDSNTSRLYFPNGTFWVMGCTSAGAEQDGGTLYPTIVEDSNGNQIIITYMAGVGVAWNNSSSRIETIEDARAKMSCGQNNTQYCSYQFSYAPFAENNGTGTTMYYLLGITSYVGT